MFLFCFLLVCAFCVPLFIRRSIPLPLALVATKSFALPTILLYMWFNIIMTLLLYAHRKIVRRKLSCTENLEPFESILHTQISSRKLQIKMRQIFNLLGLCVWKFPIHLTLNFNARVATFTHTHRNVIYSIRGHRFEEIIRKIARVFCLWKGRRHSTWELFHCARTFVKRTAKKWHFRARPISRNGTVQFSNEKN